MTIGASLFLIAVGAILRFAVNTATIWGIQLHTIGDILMIIGVVGVVLWMIIWAPWARARRTTVVRQPPVVDERPPDGYVLGADGRYHPADFDPDYPTRGYPAADPRYPSRRRL